MSGGVVHRRCRSLHQRRRRRRAESARRPAHHPRRNHRRSRHADLPGWRGHFGKLHPALFELPIPRLHGRQRLQLRPHGHHRRWHVRLLQLPGLRSGPVRQFPQRIPQYSLEVDIIADHDTTGIATNVLGAVDPLSRNENLPALRQGGQPRHQGHRLLRHADQPLNITSTAPFYPALFGGITPSNISPSLFGPFPDMDNFSTTAGSHGHRPKSNSMPAPGHDMVNIEETGRPRLIPVEEAGRQRRTAMWEPWFVNPPTASNVSPDDDLRILLAQFTTAGVVSGTMGVQFIPFDAAPR